MSTCPYCNAETRPGDVFCMTCGNRLQTSSTPQAVPGVGDSTVPTSEEWEKQQQNGASVPNHEWSDPDALTTAGPGSEIAVAEAPSSVAQATLDKIKQPARFIQHSENGDVVNEYTLDKLETNIGRAPNSDILLSKDKLTSRRHAVITYENGKYLLVDQRSANGTLINGEPLEEMVSHPLVDGDRVGIGEHEFIFRDHGVTDIEEMPTQSVLHSSNDEFTNRTQDERVYASSVLDPVTYNDENGTVSEQIELQPQPVAELEPAPEFSGDPIQAPEAVHQFAYQPEEPAAPVQPISPPVQPEQALETSPVSQAPVEESVPQSFDHDGTLNFGQLTNLSQPGLPDIAPLMAALSTLDGQVSSLREQLNSTQDAMRSHDSELARTASQLRTGVRRVADRMDSTIGDVARSRESLAWTDLLQLMEDVINNPRDIEYVTKLAKKARELNKVFQLHQSVLNTLAECNSLLRSLIGEER